MHSDNNYSNLIKTDLFDLYVPFRRREMNTTATHAHNRDPLI